MHPHALLLRLLFDAELRERFANDRDQVLAEFPGCEVLKSIDPQGLKRDATLRRRYLMSALCRAYPLSSGVLGAGGGDALAAFLASPKLLAPLAERNAAFGDHLARLVDFGDHGWLKPVLDWERALIDNAARVRAKPVPVETPSRGARKRGRLTLPAHTIVVQLPWSLELLRTALEGLNASDAWHRIDAGQVDSGRVDSVRRARPIPVTMVARGVADGPGLERAGSGGVAPLIEVTHRTAELAGTQGGRLDRLQGQKLAELGPQDQRLAKLLLDAGLLTVR